MILKKKRRKKEDEDKMEDVLFFFFFLRRRRTFLDGSKIRGLPIREDRFHVNAHVPSRTVRTADDTETESFVSRTL